jgi:hypothetical protein
MLSVAEWPEFSTKGEGRTGETWLYSECKASTWKADEEKIKKDFYRRVGNRVSEIISDDRVYIIRVGKLDVVESYATISAFDEAASPIRLVFGQLITSILADPWSAQPGEYVDFSAYYTGQPKEGETRTIEQVSMDARRDSDKVKMPGSPPVDRAYFRMDKVGWQRVTPDLG